MCALARSCLKIDACQCKNICMSACTNALPLGNALRVYNIFIVYFQFMGLYGRYRALFFYLHLIKHSTHAQTIFLIQQICIYTHISEIGSILVMQDNLENIKNINIFENLKISKNLKHLKISKISKILKKMPPNFEKMLDAIIRIHFFEHFMS